MIWTLVFALIQKESYAEIMNKESYSKIYEDVITLSNQYYNSSVIPNMIYCRTFHMNTLKNVKFTIYVET